MGLNIRKHIGKINEKIAGAKIREESQTVHRVNTLLTKKTSFAIAEAYKAARTNIIFALSSVERETTGANKVIFTSPSPGEGKTTTCLNIAIAFAQMESKVLVIDADLRKPRIYRHLQLERKNGLSDVLCGFIDVSEAINHCDEQNIDCITSGQIPPNPAELLSSVAMEHLLEKLSGIYDYIFIDTPPVTMVSEAAAMAKFVDGVVMVVRQNYTIHETLERARTGLLFAEGKILGYVLNDIDMSRYRYGNYRWYGYGKRHSKYGYYHNSYGYGYGGSGGYGYGYGYGSRYGDSYDDEDAKAQQDDAVERSKKEKKKKK